MFKNYGDGPIPDANQVSSSFLTSHLVSAMASQCVDNMHSFFAACSLGGMSDEDMKAGSPAGDKFKVPIGMSDLKNIYVKEAFDFDFSTKKYHRMFSLDGIIGTWIPEKKEYFVDTFIRPLLVSMINEASADQLSKFIDRGIIYADNALNILSAISGTIRCNPTPDINAVIKTPSSVLGGDKFANVQAQLLHNQGINSLGLLGSGAIVGVGNIHSSKALSGFASTNAESNSYSGARVFKKFSIVNQETSGDFNRAVGELSASFFYSDVNGSIEGPYSLLNTDGMWSKDTVDGLEIQYLNVTVNTATSGIVQNLINAPENAVIVINKGEPISIAGGKSARYINRSGGYFGSDMAGATFVASETVRIPLNNPESTVVKININPVPGVIIGKNIDYNNNKGEYLPVVAINNNAWDKINIFSYCAPILQQNCSKTVKVSGLPWIVCDPVVILHENTPYQYVVPSDLEAVEKIKNDEDQDLYMPKNKMGAQVYMQGDVVTNVNTVRINMFLDVGINTKSYTIAMIPRIINQYAFYENTEPVLKVEQKKKVKKEE